MKKMLLVDGNSLFFRAYYATAYTRMTTTSFGVPINAVYGFAMMLNKALELVQPQAMVVAFDSGKKTFRHDRYEDYKGTRKSLPEELITQFPIVREYCEAAGLCFWQEDGLEADDIIGSLVKRYPDWDINVLSSDKDLLQLIDKTTSVWLMKKGLTEIEEMDESKLQELWGLRPDQIPDLKGLMGDASDNIPGLPGVGEKTALKLLSEYGSVENVIANVEQLKGKLKENVLNFHEKATFSKWLATIKTDAEIHVKLADALYQANVAGANAFYEKYEMKSMIKAVHAQAEALKQADVTHFDFDAPLALFGHYRLDGDWPHTLLGIALSDGLNSSYLELETWNQLPSLHAKLSQHKALYVYDAKSLYHAQTDTFKLPLFVYDVMMMAFIEDSNLNTYDKVKEQFDWPSYPTARIDEENTQKCVAIAQRLLKSGQNIQERLVGRDLWSVYQDIDFPLVDILYRMEKEGIYVKQDILEDIAAHTLQKLNALSETIYAHAGQSFNINSPKQMCEILFNQLNLSTNRKQSTSIDVLESLRHEHPIIEPLIEYRKYQKIYSTYAIGLQKFIQKDKKIHTVYAMTIAQTGRLSSTDPNLQNISIRDEEAREIRKAFVSSPGNVLYSCDYSQIELRVLAHMANEQALIEAFKQGLDVHTKTAMDVFGLAKEEVGSNERRAAKAVNFGIIYGISDFGLAAQINADRKTAKHFIDRYLKTYQGISTYMDQTIANCQNLGYVETLYKRRRYLPEIKASNYQVREFAKRAAMNAPIQGSAADIMKIAMIKVDDALKDAKLKAKMILQVHDELVFDVPEEELESVRELVEKTMRDAVRLKVPMEVSSAWGANWYEAK